MGLPIKHKVESDRQNRNPLMDSSEEILLRETSKYCS
jgi:hypothetical protein